MSILTIFADFLDKKLFTLPEKCLPINPRKPTLTPDEIMTIM